MVVERDMQIAVAIRHDAYDVVSILHMALILGLLQNKFCVAELTFAQSKPSCRIVICYILRLAKGCHRAVAEHGGIDGIVAISDACFDESWQFHLRLTACQQQ